MRAVFSLDGLRCVALRAGSKEKKRHACGFFFDFTTQSITSQHLT
jgi:hypothetical protein